MDGSSRCGDADHLNEEGDGVEGDEDGGDPAGWDPQRAEAEFGVGRDEPDEAAEGHVAGCGHEGGADAAGAVSASVVVVEVKKWWGAYMMRTYCTTKACSALTSFA